MIHDDMKFLQQLHRETMEAMQKDLREKKVVCFLTVGTWKKIFVTMGLLFGAAVLVWYLHWTGIHWHRE